MCLLILKKMSQTKCFLNVETGSLIFAILNCLTLSGFSIISVILLVGIVCHAFPDVELRLVVYGVFQNALVNYSFLLVFLYTFFAFSIILIGGLLTRNSTQVKIYFIFGVVVSFLSLGALIAFSSLLTFPFYYEDLVHATKVSVLIVICIYVLILIMIRDTYKKFAKEEESNSPEKKLFIVSRLNVETGSLIFAILNCLTLSGFSLISVILLVGIVCHAFPEVKLMLEVYGVFQNALVNYSFLLVFLYTFFAFSIILIGGLLMRNSTQVKIYFIFGVVVSFLSLGALIAFSSLLTFPFYYEDLVHATKVSVLIVICIYVLILIMIHDTYKKFAKEEESNSPEKKMFIVSSMFKNLVSKDILTEELVPKLKKV